jgi:uncharacterized RDD family membrane protein YckC
MPVCHSASAAFRLSWGARERRDGSMTVADADGGRGETFGPAYARFLPRLRALFIDSIVMMVVVFGVLMVAIIIRSDNIARVLGFTVAAVWLLYEPVLVSFAGGTIGHRRTNLRVVDERTRRNIGIIKSFARTVIKAALGWFSFLTMLTTRRSQAMHDLLTRSTVQVRDLSTAGPRLYIHEREEFASDTMPSRTRRVLVIGVYLLAALMLLVVLRDLVAQSGLISDLCVRASKCSQRENITVGIPAAGWLAGCLLCIVLGWRGRLFGCRIARTH